MSHSYRVVHVAMLIDAINIEIGCIECDIMKPNEIHGVFHYYYSDNASISQTYNISASIL
jgi:hypothetical protein